MRSNNFDVKIPGSLHSGVKAWSNSCENKASEWTDFKNSFTWLTCMKKLIFWYNDFFGSGHFSIYEILKKAQKWQEPKKVVGSKKQSFHTCWPPEGTFQICLFWGLIFTTVCPSFCSTVQGARDFNTKIIWPHEFIWTRST